MKESYGLGEGFERELNGVGSRPVERIGVVAKVVAETWPAHP